MSERLTDTREEAVQIIGDFVTKHGVTQGDIEVAFWDPRGKNTVDPYTAVFIRIHGSQGDVLGFKGSYGMIASVVDASGQGTKLIDYGNDEVRKAPFRDGDFASLVNDMRSEFEKGAAVPSRVIVPQLEVSAFKGAVFKAFGL